MKKYTVETLKKENYHFDNVHGITEADVTKVNKIITMIEKLRLTRTRSSWGRSTIYK